MATQTNRLASGGVIDRGRTVAFTFNGRSLSGHAGDTLASALLANGIHLVGRSFKYHRPRGILAAGPEEPNAWVQLGTGGFEEPNVAATTAELYEGLIAKSPNCWPSVNFDLAAINDRFSSLLVPGFYYKTFMNPRWLWPRYEKAIRQMAGVGTLPPERDAEPYQERHVHADVLVVGGGPAGLAAARAAAKGGARVILAEADREFGGALIGGAEKIDGKPAADWVAEVLAELRANERVRVLGRTTVFGYYEHNYLAAIEKVTDHLPVKKRNGPRQRLWQIRARQVVIATGAHERPLVFANNDRPGVMLAGSVRTYVNRYAVRPGRRTVVFTNNDSAYAAAMDMHAAGIKVVAIVDTRRDAQAVGRAAKAAGIKVFTGSAVAQVNGAKHVASVDIIGFDPSSDGAPSRRVVLECDLLCVSGGWSPVVHLYSQAGGKLSYDSGLACFRPHAGQPNTFVAGSTNAAFSLSRCLDEGHRSGIAAATAAGHPVANHAAPDGGDAATPDPIMPVWSVPALKANAKRFVDYFGDVTTSGIALAAREGYVSVEHLKRYTTAGMGGEQGKTGNLNALALLAREIGSRIPDVGTTTYRPPYTPVAFGALAGGRAGEHYKPLRRTAMDSWHERQNAVFENSGLWRRPQYYRGHGTTMAEAVAAEVRNVRNNVGLVDISTLGKIHLHGPDVGELLNRLYTNRWDNLKPGRSRYGVMLREDGMVFDDGVTTRLGELDYHMTTTTGGAPAVFNWINDLLQSDWPDLRVLMTSVTTQWAAVAVAGPNARRLLRRVCTDIDLSQEAFPFLAFREGTIAGIPARIFAISFTGELSYEVNVPARYGLALWEALMVAGAPDGVMPFGIEAMDTMRMEKGHFIVGRDTDGTVTPNDLGLQWLVKQDKAQFLGKRSLSLVELARTDRPQMVGLLTDDKAKVIPEGAQIIRQMRAERPLPLEGHVTSSCMSPTLGRGIALAALNGGQARMGEKLMVYSLGKTWPVTVCDPHFYDPENSRIHL